MKREFLRNSFVEKVRDGFEREETEDEFLAISNSADDSETVGALTDTEEFQNLLNEASTGDIFTDCWWKYLILLETVNA